jgi:endonuclease YncB( thermonuclease family)
MYNDQFFGNAMTEDGYRRRLRAVIQNTLTDFEETLREEGHARVIVETPEEEVLGPNGISRSDYLEEVTQLMRRSRGCGKNFFSTLSRTGSILILFESAE